MNRRDLHNVWKYVRSCLTLLWSTTLKMYSEGDNYKLIFRTFSEHKNDVEVDQRKKTVPISVHVWRHIRVSSLCAYLIALHNK